MPTEIETTVATEPADTGATMATPEISSPAPEVTPDASGSADAATQSTPDASAGSFKTDTRSNALNQQPPTAVAPPNPALPAQPVDWQKRYSDLQRHSQQLSEQAKQYQAQLEPWQGLDPRQVREQIARQQQIAESQKLHPWHPRHPDASKTETRLGRVKNYLAAAQALPEGMDPGIRQQAISNMQQRMGVTPEDAQLYKDHEDHVQRSVQEFTHDPETFIRERARAEIQTALQEFETFQATRAQTQQFISDPQNAPLIQEHAQTILWGMNNPARREVGLKLAQLEHENAQLRSRIDTQKETVSTAEAQSQALKGKARVTRDLKASPVTGDPVQTGLALGLRGDALRKHIENANKRAQSQE